MVKLVKNRLECALQVTEIHDPAGLVADITPDVDFDAKGMAMHSGALVPLGHIRQKMGRFDLENAKDIHGAHCEYRASPTQAGNGRGFPLRVPGSLAILPLSPRPRHR